MHKIDPGIEIASVAHIPAGTGLGSSSSFSVALIDARELNLPGRDKCLSRFDSN
jgi:galactokinase/mevalonate kinase-like predicted kinase